MSTAPTGNRLTQSLFVDETSKRFRTSAKDAGNMTELHIKPALLESKASKQQKFFGLSDGFKKCFTDDQKDRKMVIPVCGYGGHRRGDRSQNFFGKNFRDTTI